MAPHHDVPQRFGSSWRIGLTDVDRQALAEDENPSVDPPVLPPPSLAVAQSLPRPASHPPATSPIVPRK